LLRGKSILALEWNRKDLRMVVVRAKGAGVDLVKAVSVPIPAEVHMEVPESLGGFIRAAIHSADLGAKRVLLSIPRDQVVLNTLSLPPTPAEELASIVQFQVVKELPFPADQATLDFAVCGEFDPKLPSSVLVAAVRNEDLDFYRKLAAAADLSVERIGLRPHANLLALTTNWPELAMKTVLLVEVGPQLTEIDIIKSGVLSFSRAASVALSDIIAGSDAALSDSRIQSAPLRDHEPSEQTQRAVSDLMVDIIRSFEAYRATDSSVSVDQIVVCGASGLEPLLAQALAARFAARAELFAPTQALGLPPARARELRGFSATIGLALGYGETGVGQFDFLSPKKPVSKRSIQMKKVPVAAVTAFLFLASGFVFYYKSVAPKQAQAEQLRAQVNEKKKKEKSILEFKAQVDAIDDWIASQQIWPEVLVALSEVFPDEKEAYITRVDFETRPVQKSDRRASAAKLKFRTVSLGTVNNLTAKLQTAGFLNVVPGKETSSPSPDGYSNDSGIDADVAPRSTARDDLNSKKAVEARPSSPSDAPTPTKPVESAGVTESGKSDASKDVAAPKAPKLSPTSQPSTGTGLPGGRR
jgi:type IV pilus assembly protein PilM